LVSRAQDNPVDAKIWVLADQLQNGPPTADFNVVAMRAKTQNLRRRVLSKIEAYFEHELLSLQVYDGSPNREARLGTAAVYLRELERKPRPGHAKDHQGNA
jgi:hypothetical protein